MTCFFGNTRFMMAHGASDNGRASASHARFAMMSRFSTANIALLLDASILASIIICALSMMILAAVLVSVLVALISLLVLVLLVMEYLHRPRWGA